MADDTGSGQDKPDLTKGASVSGNVTGSAGGTTWTGPAGPHPSTRPELVREQSYACDGPAELDLAVNVGQVRARLVDEDGLHVEVRHDPNLGASWTTGLTGLLNWLGEATGGPVTDPADLAADAVAATEISWSEGGRRLVVRSPEDLPLRMVPLTVTVRAPVGSRLAARTGAGDVSVTGRSGWTAVKTGSGDVDVEDVGGDAELTTGSGDLRVGPVGGRARVRTGSGEVRLGAVAAPSEMKTGSGDVRVGDVGADLTVRTGSGSVTVDDARSGRLDLSTGSGDLRVAVHAGVVAELDVSTGSGRARSELEVRGTPPDGATAVVVRGRTGSGDVLVRRAG